MKKFRKNAKALSPVVASIILIAVTVAVSIAVAAWMGALTFTFMGTEEIKLTDLNFDTTGEIGAFCRNTGTSPVTLIEAWINGVKYAGTWSDVTIAANGNATVTLTYNWVPGDTYKVELISSKGNNFLRTETAPNA